MSDIQRYLRCARSGDMLADSNGAWCKYDEAAAEIERLRQTDVAWASDTIKLLVTIKYLVGIAERGEGREISSKETAEGFVLAYVKKLESEIERLRELLREGIMAIDVSGSDDDEVFAAHWPERVREALGE